jgi:MFS family permease
MTIDQGSRRRMPGTVWALGLVSMFMDISSEMIHSLLPVFLVSALHASVLTVGLIEGAAESVALITRTFSGALSDRLGRRKTLAMAGYGLGALAKPFFAMAAGAGLVFGARFADRIGKGIRGAPRDALVADVTPADMRGEAFGLRQSMDTAGAFLGPLLAAALMLATDDNYRTVFWVAVIPAALAVAVLAAAVKEPDTPGAAAPGAGFHLRDTARLGRPYWAVVACGTVFTLARFSEAFLLLRAESVGIDPSLIPAVLVVMNLVYALTAYPAGYLSDRWGRTGLIGFGLAALIASDLLLASVESRWALAAGVALWGLHMGLVQGLLSAMVADTAAAGLRGTAFGLFGLAAGLATLLASVAAGWLWQRYEPAVTFLAGAGLAAVTLAGMLALRRHLPSH